MRFLLRTLATGIIALKRLLSQKGLVLAIILGLVASVALVMCIPLYADAVYERLFREEINSASKGEDNPRPPFAYLFRYYGSWSEIVDWEKVKQVDDYLTQSGSRSLGMPEEMLVRYFKTDTYGVYPTNTTVFSSLQKPVFWAGIGFLSNYQDHIQVVEGNFPLVAGNNPETVVEVLITPDLAAKSGLQVGESYLVYVPEETETGEFIRTIIPVRIAGVWQPSDLTDPYWFYKPDAFSDTMLVPEETYHNRVGAYIRNEVFLGIWYFILDGSNVNPSEAGPLLRRSTAVLARANSLLEGVRFAYSPIEALGKYQRASQLLTILLFAFSIPIFGLILAFISLVAGLYVERQRNEIAVLRSRGATTFQVGTIVLLEGLFLGIASLVIGSVLGLQVAQWIGKTRSFLDFNLEQILQVKLSETALRSGAIAVLLALSAQLIPAVNAARHTIVSYRQERARSLRPPWWQRAWLDLLLLIPAGYGAYILHQQGSLVNLEGGKSTDPFQNPLLFLVPSLGILALSLFVLRLVPFLMRGIVWLAGHTRSVGLLMAARRLQRMPGSYATPLLLLILTLSLSAFTASLAQTIDNHLYAQANYRVGADMAFFEFGERSVGDSSRVPIIESAEESDSLDSQNEPLWIFIPVSEYTLVPGIQAATRVGRYQAFPLVGTDERIKAVFYGVDRLDLPRLAYWREDFAAESLGGLMNRLAAQSDGVLVTPQFLNEHSLSVGSALRISIRLAGQDIPFDFMVVGTVNLFPTWYPDDGPLFIGNLDYIFGQAGYEYPYDVWVKLEPGAVPQEIVQRSRDVRGLYILNWETPINEISQEQVRPERQGLFGVLSVGFSAAALLTVAGFLLYSLFSFRRQFIELGVMRAVGLSVRQMASYLVWELSFFLLIGGTMGTLLGVAASRWFIPYLQVGYNAASRVPPFIVEISWPAIFRVYALFGILFLITLVVLVILLTRMKIFQAIKLGETV